MSKRYARPCLLDQKFTFFDSVDGPFFFNGSRPIQFEVWTSAFIKWNHFAEFFWTVSVFSWAIISSFMGQLLFVLSWCFPGEFLKWRLVTRLAVITWLEDLGWWEFFLNSFCFSNYRHFQGGKCIFVKSVNLPHKITNQIHYIFKFGKITGLLYFVT